MCLFCTVTFNGGTGNLKNAKVGAIVKRVFCITFTLLVYSYLYLSLTMKIRHWEEI